MTVDRLTPDGVYELRNAGRRAYPQVIRVAGGMQIFLSGMVALDPEGALIGEGDMVAQAAATYANVGQALAAASAGAEDVVSCTVYATDLGSYRRAGRLVAAEFFGATRPTSTVVEVTRLADPRYLLEVQVIAVVG